MDNKSDVKSIMARFQAGNASVEGNPVVRPKPTVQPTLSSGSSVPVKKPVLEHTLSGGATTTSSAPKPNFVKSTVNSARSAPDMHDAQKLKTSIGRFENGPENKVNFKVPVKPKPPDSSQDSEPKVTFTKGALQKPSPIGMATDLKGSIPKHSAPTVKPPWVKETTKPEDNSGSPNHSHPKVPSAQKPKSTVAMIRQQREESSNADPPVKTTSISNVKPSSFRVKNNFNKAEESVNEGVKTQSAHETVPKPVTQKPNFPKKPVGSPAQTLSDNLSTPKKKPILNSFALGNAPAKPNRPPKVNLEKFKRTDAATESPAPKTVTAPPPPASHPSNQAAPPLPSQPNPPSLPPRPTGPLIQDENYDDVECVRGGQKNDGSGSDGEIYEDLDDSRSAAESCQPQKKQDKEQETKNQKEREKKEKAVKKFKLTLPLQVIHRVKAKSDCKGGKNDLSIKKGESIDIIRINDNPEGKWLGRGQDGSYGFVKTEMVEINFSALKNQGLSFPINEEVYDDVGSQDDHGGMNGQRVVLPPPPDDDVYDDIPEPNINPISTADPRFLLKPRNFLEILKSSVERRKSQIHNNDIPPPAQFTPEGNKDNAQDGEIYDDVDHPSPLPPPPPPISTLHTKSKGAKVHDDPKKQKKFEKEEKEFRKKFKYDGEIHVLHQATIASSKKGSGKDLTVQAGESVDVISKSDPEKLICRNKEGKFGYVTASNIQQDEEVYDDIGDDCIYDND